MSDFLFTDTIINLLLAAIWIVAWNHEARETVFNAYLARLSGAVEAWLALLRPVCGRRRLPGLLGTFGVLLLLRALLVTADTRWSLRLGFQGLGMGGDDPLGALLAMSALSFGVILFKLWGLTLFYPHGQDAWGQAGGALHRAARPFTAPPLALRPFALLGLGVALSLAMHALAYGNLAHLTPAMIPTLLASVLAGWVQIIGMIRSVMWLLIIGSLVSMFAGGYGVRQVCDDWISLLLGPLRRYPLRVGMFDLTPWAFLLLATWLEAGLLNLLARVPAGGLL